MCSCAWALSPAILPTRVASVHQWITFTSPVQSSGVYPMSTRPGIGFLPHLVRPVFLRVFSFICPTHHATLAVEEIEEHGRLSNREKCKQKDVSNRGKLHERGFHLVKSLRETPTLVRMPGILPMKVIKVGSSAQSRIAQACDRCRSKKIRCDGIRPCCSQCANVGFECKTSDKLSRRAFPRGYTESLEERVRSLEAEVRELKDLLDEKDEK